MGPQISPPRKLCHQNIGRPPTYGNLEMRRGRVTAPGGPDVKIHGVAMCSAVGQNGCSWHSISPIAPRQATQQVGRFALLVGQTGLYHTISGISCRGHGLSPRRGELEISSQAASPSGAGRDHGIYIRYTHPSCWDAGQALGQMLLDPSTPDHHHHDNVSCASRTHTRPST